ncbi:contractile injection system tape measure protein [Aquipluma nitroreducens]|uniref:contractile injection system tape measure protein n=1 Tax=Aquipluma nitroreducens TaxID=2010828 RepID=UPI00296FB3DA|nr:contractile injection system tape measure protein [Aquipluma nitroreducens]
MKGSQNIIHTAIFNFEYGSTASASRCNDLIESIFNAQILPELEKAISRKIQDGLLIELSKLEINIGNIHERDITANLASRVRLSLEEALHGKFNIKSGVGNTIGEAQINGEYLLESIETFLKNGYFLFGFAQSTTIDDLIEDALRNNKKDLIDLLLKHKNQERFLRRMANSLSLITYDNLLEAVAPDNYNWIIAFRKALVQACTDAKLDAFKRGNLTQTINYSIFKYLLNETSPIFYREKFSKSIFHELSIGSADEIQALIHSIENQNDTSTGTIYEALTVLENDQERSFGIEQILKLLNAGSFHSKNANRDQLKDEIIRSIRDQSTRDAFIERLSEMGLIQLIQIFDPNAQDLYKLIASFSERFEHQNSLKTIIAEHVLLTVNYLNESAIRQLNKEEYLLFLMYAFPDRQLNTEELLDFAKTQKSIDSKKLGALIAAEQNDQEISGLSQLLTKRQKNPKIYQADNQLSNKLTAEFIEMSKRKIISNFLDSGELSTTFYDLSINDIKTIFEEFILQKDDFLKRIIHRNANSQKLIDRLLLLTSKENEVNLWDYLIHFFPEEYRVFTEIIAKERHQLLAEVSEISSKNNLFIRILAESNGGSLPNAFVVSVIENLADQFAVNPVQFIQIWTSKIRKEVGVITLDNHIKNLIERDLKQLVNRFSLSENTESLPEYDSKQLVKKIILHFNIDPTVFMEMIRKNTVHLRLIYTLLKLYVEPSQWISVEKAFLSEFDLKNRIVDFQQYQDPSLMHIMPEDALSQELPSIQIDSDILRKIVSSQDKAGVYIAELLAFSPGYLTEKVNPECWKSITLSFAALNSMEEKEFNPLEFAKAFAKHLLQKLKAVNEEEMYYLLLDQMKASDLQKINELYNLLQLPDKRVSYSRKGNSSKVGRSEVDLSGEKLSHYFSILKFYAANGFLPWWANQLSFTEIIEGLNATGDQYPREFEEMFLQAEKEDQLFEKLILNIPEYLSVKFDQIMSKHLNLKEVWQTVRSKKNHQNNDLQNAKNIKSDLLKKLYALSNDEILLVLNLKNSDISKQVKAYLNLSSYFYFRHINPAQWRKMVLEFIIDYNSATTEFSESKFHYDFLNHLKSNASQINWEKTLSQVYQLTLLSKSDKNVVFPEVLKQLINTKTDNSSAKIETMDTNNELFADKSGTEVQIYNAGLILYWPFLTRLFEILSFVESGNFVGDESRNRAVYLLQYLATNRIDFPENLFVLNKLLVGMDVQEILSPIVELTEDEMASAVSLQNGLINNWEKVRNSTPEGIQETFVQREGILRFDADKITLVVEKHGVDVLLESIPWNISLVKLSWMTMPIYVEWV